MNYKALFLYSMVLFAFSLADGKTFNYKNGLTVEAASFNDAAKKCFRLLTKNEYPGEEKGLEIIDICVNPINKERK